MPFKERKPRGPRKPKPAEGIVSEVVSIVDTPPDAVAKLLKEINDLKSKLAVSDAARGVAEQQALDAAQSQGALMQVGIEEVPTGKTVEISRCTGYKTVGHKDDGRDIRRPVFTAVKIPTFFYKVDMPPCGGTDFKINELPYYHGTVYEFDIDTLRSVKEIIYRLWDHDRNTHGSNENAYRRKTTPRLSARQV